MKVTWKRVLFGIVVSGIFIYLTIRGLNWKDVYEHLKSLNPLYFLITIFFTFVAMYLRGLRWRFLLLNYKNLSSLYLFSIELVGYMVNYLLPGKLGEIVKAYVVGEEKKMSKGVVFGTVVVERILDLFFILLIGIFLPGRLKSKVPVTAKISIVSLIILIIVIIGIVVLHLLKHKLERVKPEGVKGKIFNSVRMFSKGLDAIGKPFIIIVSFLITGLVWLFTLLQLYFLMPGLEIKPDFTIAIFAMFLFTLGITIPSSPGDIGPFHYFITIALVAGGIDWNLAFAFAVIYHLSQFITVVPSGIMLSLKKGISYKEVK